ncbi:hypothetical protein ACFWN2_43270 [Lentzea sp. NPDC058436]|uniref:hypothetical protein n=1 Tax=Lentzea sp. NPDC058436 TaxID=3346499 RepID=UPI003660C720
MTDEISNSVTGDVHGTVVQIGTVQQLHFHGGYQRLHDVTLDLDLLPAELRLTDAEGPVGLFTGRDWLIEQIDAFIAGCVRDGVGGHLVVEAEAGMGKTALATYLAFTRDYPTHVTRLPGGTSPETARTNLAAQVIARWELDSAPAGVLPSGHDTTGWLAKQLLAAARRRDEVAPDTPVVLLVDGLDEAPPPAPGELPLGLPRSLPPGTVLIVTTRPGTRLPHGLGRVHRIEVESASNRRDLASFLDRVTRRDPRLSSAIDAAGFGADQFRRLLAERSGGVWIYATYVLEQIRGGASADIARLPHGLADYYADNIARWSASPTWQSVGLPLLASLAAARRPLPAGLLALWVSLDLAAVKSLLRGPFKPFLVTRSGGDPDTYALRHQSFRDFCNGEVPGDHLRELANDLAAATQDVHRRLVDALPLDSEYAREHLAQHAALSGRLDELLDQPDFLLTTSVPALLRQRRHVSEASQSTLAVVEMAANAWRSDTDRRDAMLVAALKIGVTTLADQLRPPDGWRARHALWRGTSHSLLDTRINHPEAVAVVPLPDGSTLLAISGEYKVVRLMDAATGARRGEFGTASAVQALAFVPMPDDTVLLAVAEDDEVTLRDLTGEVVRALPRHVTHRRNTVQRLVLVSLPGGALLAGSGPDHVVRLWDPATGALRGELTGHHSTIWALSALPRPDGTTLLASGGDDDLRVWDPVTSACLRTIPRVHYNRTFASTLVPMPDGTVCLAASGWRDAGAAGSDHVVRLWDIATGELRHEIPLRGNEIRSLVVCSASLLAGAGQDGVIRLWDLTSLTPHGELEGHTGGVRTLVSVPSDRTMLASACTNHEVRVWDVAASRLHGTVKGHVGEVRALTTVRLDDGTTLVASGGTDRVIRLWNPTTGTLHRELHGHSRTIKELDTAPLSDGTNVIVSVDEETVRFWNPATGESTTAVHIYHRDHDNSRLAVLRTQDGTCLLARTASTIKDGYDYLDSDSPMEKYEKLINLSSITPSATRVAQAGYGVDLNGHNVIPITCLSPLRLPDGTQLLASAEDQCVKLWHPITCEVHEEIDAGYVSAMTTVPTPRGDVLAIAGDEAVRLWDSTTGTSRSIPVAAAIWRMIAVPTSSGFLLAGTGEDRVVRLWDPFDGELVRELEGHTAAVRDLATLALPDGTTVLVSGSWHGEIVFWELADRS